MDRRTTQPPQGTASPGIGRLRSVPLILAAIVTLTAGVLPVSAADPPPEPPPVEDPGTGFGGDVEPEVRVCDPEPCPETQTTTGGAGGFVPVAAERVLDTPATSQPLVRGETRTVAVGGIGSVPADGIEAVALSVTGQGAVLATGVTVWPAGAARPSAPTLEIQPGRVDRVMVVVPLGTDGRVAVFAERRVDVVIDVLGWFAWASEYHAVGPMRVFDTVGAPGTRPAPLGAAQTVTVELVERAGLPEDVRGVVLRLASHASTRASAITVWPTGTDRPDAATLSTAPLDRRTNLAVVTPGADGTISVRNATGSTHLAIDIIGWLPAAASYRTVTPAALQPADGVSLATGLKAGATVEYEVTGVAGVPDGTEEGATASAYAVALNLTATPRNLKVSRLVAWPAGDAEPDTTSVVTGALPVATTSLTIVRVGNDGRVALHNLGGSADVRVDIVGWFAQPIVAAQLEVPETTVVPDPETVTPLEVVTGPGPEPDDPPQIVEATISLDPALAPVEIGDHLVLGAGGAIGVAGTDARLAADVTVDDAFPEGFLGEIVSVETAPDGTQTVVATPAMLEDVFPEGDIAVDLNTETEYEGQLLWGPAPADEPSVVLAAVQTPTKGVQVDFEYLGDGKKGKDPATDVECSMDGIEATFAPLIDMQFSVRWRWFKAPVVTALATLGADARIALEDVAVRCGIDIKLWKATVTFTAGPVPVVVVFEVGAALDIAAGLDGLLLEANAGAAITVGVKSNAGYADADYWFDATSFDELAAQLTNLSVYGQADVWIKFGVKLYGVIGPRISVGPFVEAVITSAPAQPWWRLDFGVAGRVELSLDLWFKSWDWNLYEAEIPLADLLAFVNLLEDCPTMPYAVGSGGEEPCRSPKPAQRADPTSGESRTLAARIRLASAGRPFQALSIGLPSPVPAAAMGQPYAAALTSSGLFSGASQVLWSLRSGPEWLTLRQDGSGAVLEGTPTTYGTATAIVDLRQAWDAPGVVRDTETVTIAVAPANDPPVATGKDVIVPAAGPATAISLAGTDAETPAGALRVTIASLPSLGTLQRDGANLAVGDQLPLADPVVSYVPSGVAGPDAFTFTVTDTGVPPGCTGDPAVCAPAQTSAPGIVSVTVIETANAAPVCEGGWTNTFEGQGFATEVICTDPDGDPLTYAIATYPAHGTLTMTSEDTFEYEAPVGYTGPDPWTFTASDGQLTSAPATFLVDVLPPHAIRNGGFETGDLSDWAVEKESGAGRAETSGWFNYGASVGPTEGSWFALLGEYGTVSLRQDVTVEVGDVLTGMAWIYGDGSITILDAQGDVVATPLATATWPTWVRWSHPFATGGVYTVVATSSGGYLGLDEVALVPSSIANGDFESGDLWGWEVSPNPGRAETSAWFVIGAGAAGAAGGEWFGLVGTRDPGTGENRDTTVSRTIWADAGDTLTGSAWTYGAGARLRLLDSHGTVVATLSTPGTFPTWTPWTHTFAGSGVYRIVGEATGTFTFLGIDEVALTE